MKYVNKYCSSIIKGFLATLLMGFGIALFIASELGSDPMTVFLDGFHRVTGIPVSVTDQVINLGILFLALLVNRSRVGVNTIVCVLSLGICIQIPTSLLVPFNLAHQSMMTRFLFMMLGQICLTLAYAWTQTFEDGINSLDCIFFKIIEKTKIKYHTIRILYDGFFITVGFVMGGIVGIGTIISLMTNGIMVEKFRKLINCITNSVNKFSKRKVKVNG